MGGHGAVRVSCVLCAVRGEWVCERRAVFSWVVQGMGPRNGGVYVGWVMGFFHQVCGCSGGQFEVSCSDSGVAMRRPKVVVVRGGEGPSAAQCCVLGVGDDGN